MKRYVLAEPIDPYPGPPSKATIGSSGGRERSVWRTTA
jgi:hypothetical protein